ncbi:MAG: AmmeMemoRadiSam system radical SAM enzyme [Pirellulales bacterium]|nr:AmmeMemoRadiSam system radical SAM enzyme [Pirellulales bacterium]
MPRTITLPPSESPEPNGTKAGGWWHETEDGRKLVCDLCPRACTLSPGDRGFCFVRQNLDGRMVSTTYGRSTGFCIDPIEKKPLNHFFPGTAVLSFGTAGCNLGCKFCQNWSISKSREIASLSETADPESIAEAARQTGSLSVAFTYNDPVIWAEYAIDTATACHDAGIKTVAVTAGYITPVARGPFFRVMDAANVDLKGFTEQFYFKLASGHLDPVLDTLRWLVHESDVWVELTTLIIPQANDSDDELKRMCDWIAAELRPDVPIHFTAFHPDFRLRDRSPTPVSTLQRAYRTARAAGLQYVYTGNVSDREHQSTFCPGCGRVVIERDRYYLGVYALDGNRCRHCGAQVKGRFDLAPGDWGARRMPIRISAFAAEKPVPMPVNQGATTMQPTPQEQPQPARVASRRPPLDEAQEGLLFRTAGRRVAAAVQSQPAERVDESLGELARVPLLGAFVSLKRRGQLRSCCGFLGQSVPMAEAIDHAAVRAAKDDPRFPPISPTELEHLDMEVWLLWGLEQVKARGEDRVEAITIGKHGLQIARGGNRGLLLPGVAVEHGLDAQGFLEQVCRKAGLPHGAWKDDDAVLMTFEGYAIHGRLAETLVGSTEQAADGGPTVAEIAVLADFCRRNLAALVEGATPSFYLPGGYDGSVAGVTLTLRLPGRENAIELSKINLRPDLPLQSSLFELTQSAAGTLRQRRIPAGAVAESHVGVSVFWDSAMHATAAGPELEGVEPRRRAILANFGSKWVIVFDPEKSPEQLVTDAVRQGRFHDPARCSLSSLAVSSTEPRLVLTNVAHPQTGPEVRPPAVAGRFYPGNADELRRMLDEFFPNGRKPQPWAAALVPHAGWVYSGRLAAETLSRIEIPERVIVVCPKHTRPGADWAVAPHHAWSLPGGCVESDPELAQRLAEAVTGLELDAAAHQSEHAIEVQLPILQRLAPQSRVVGIAIHGGDLAALERFADEMAGVLAGLPERPLLVVSSDMNHYAPDDATRKIDRIALDAIETLDPARLYETVIEKRISMCGVLPAVLVLQTLRRLDALHRYEPVGYATSADASGDRDRVVGYAGMLFA